MAFRPAILDFDVLTFEVAVIAATGGEPSALAKAATVKTPVVFTLGGEAGLVASLNLSAAISQAPRSCPAPSSDEASYRFDDYSERGLV